MADEFHTSGSWWDSARNRYHETGASQSSSTGLTSMVSFGWPTDMAADMKTKSSMDSGAPVSGSSVAFHGQDSASGGGDSSGVLVDPNLQMMGLGLSSPAMDWNQTLLRGEKAENSFRSMLQENLNTSANFQQESELQWKEKLYSGGGGGESSAADYKQISRGFSLDQSNSGESTVTACQGLSSSFHMDSNMYGLLGSDNLQERSSMNYQYPGANYSNFNELLPSWSSKVPNFLRNSPPKQATSQSHLQFSNNAPFWNASSAVAMNDARSSFFPSLQPQFPPPNFDDNKAKITQEVRDSSASVKKSNTGGEPASKRPRNETPSPLPAFKVRKEKMGDRITALQQLVSPFGKTDTASVLSEAIEYIKFLHEQVTVLSNPYMKSGAQTQHHQQNYEKSKDPEGPKQDLRSRGLCLVPVSSTFPVTHETTVEFWNPTFGGTFR